MNKSNTETLGCWVALFSTPVSSLLHGFVMCQLWSWFVVPALHAPPLRIPFALGISLLATFLTTPISTKKSVETEDKPLLQICIETLLQPVMALAIGWIYHLFV